MSTLLLSDTNLAARRMTWANELGFTTDSLSTSQVVTSNTIQIPVPVNVIFRIQLSAGAIAIDYAVHDGSPVYTGSPLDIANSDTAWHEVAFQTTVDDPMFTLKLTGDASHAPTIAAAAAYALGILSQTGYHEAGDAFNDENLATGIGTFSDTLA